MPRSRVQRRTIAIQGSAGDADRRDACAPRRLVPFSHRERRERAEIFRFRFERSETIEIKCRWNNTVFFFFGFCRKKRFEIPISLFFPQSNVFLIALKNKSREAQLIANTTLFLAFRLQRNDLTTRYLLASRCNKRRNEIEPEQTVYRLRRRP